MILPLQRETLVLPHKADDVIERLRAHTRQGRREGWEPGDEVFMGVIRERYFDITRILKRPENFMPQLQGTIEESSTGSIVFLKYTLQFSSKMFVIFWSLTTFFFAIFLWFIQYHFWLGIASIGALVINLAITHISFRRQLKISRQAFLDVVVGH